jgi:protein-tyrosine phosphatase
LWGQRVIDIHSHILPNVDDGPKSWEVAAEMCRLAAEDGITQMVATPHSNDHYDFDVMYLRECRRRLQELVGDSPKLSLGCDFHLSYENLQSVLSHPQDYTIGGSRYLLVELSDFSIPTQIGECFFKLADAGVTAVITHPERNPILRRSPQRLMEWIDQGCLVQVTANALTGFWGNRVARFAAWLLEHEAVHVLASDAHDPKHRPPILSAGRDAAADICGDSIADALVESNPAAILSGQPLPYSPNPVLKGL